MSIPFESVAGAGGSDEDGGSAGTGAMGGNGGKSAPQSSGAGGAGSGSGGSSGLNGTSGSAAAIDPGGSGGSNSSAGNPVDCADSVSVITADPSRNYGFSAQLELPPVYVKPGSELTFEWGGVTRDLFGQPLDPLDVVIASYDMVHLAPDEYARMLIEDDLAGETLSEPYVTGAQEFAPRRRTSATLFEFGRGSDAGMLRYFDASEYPPDEYTYVVTIWTWGTLFSSRAVRMYQSFKLDPDSENTTVTLTETSAPLAYTIELTDIEPVPVRAGSTAIDVDWSELLATPWGTEFYPEAIDEIRVSRFDETLDELEARFFELEGLARETYRVEVDSLTSTTTSLEEAVTDEDEPFTGITAQGTWLLDLRCNYSCVNPVPRFVAHLTACSDSAPR
ncbi:MAG TPA: hypothetical protein VGK73_29020 [Polyangiaceae bacterium]